MDNYEHLRNLSEFSRMYFSINNQESSEFEIMDCKKRNLLISKLKFFNESFSLLDIGLTSNIYLNLKSITICFKFHYSFFEGSIVFYIDPDLFINRNLNYLDPLSGIGYSNYL